MNSMDEFDYLSSNGGTGDNSVAVENPMVDELDYAAQQESKEWEQSPKRDVAQTEDSKDGIAAALQTSETVASTSTRGDSELGYDLAQDVLGDEETRANGHYSRDGELGHSVIPSSPQRPLRAIEIVLSPPSDPDSYYRIPRSYTVLRVSGEAESGDETFYKVEFKDGRIKYVSVKSINPAELFILEDYPWLGVRSAYFAFLNLNMNITLQTLHVLSITLSSTTPIKHPLIATYTTLAMRALSNTYLLYIHTYIHARNCLHFYPITLFFFSSSCIVEC